MRTRLISRCADDPHGYDTDLAFGPLAQLGEHLVCNQGAVSFRSHTRSEGVDVSGKVSPMREPP
jgi:uncharacterized protein (DUF2237 family)